MDKIEQEQNYKYLFSIFSAFSDEFNKSIVLNTMTRNSLTFITNYTSKLSSFILSIIASFEEMRAANTSISDNIENIKSEMISVLEMNKHLNEKLNERTDEIQDSSTQIDKALYMFNELMKKSEAVFSVTKSITEVSEKTNVLAINASIEAAHAGQYGKGFSIIAKEIRNLANQTKSFTKNINETINDFKNNVYIINDYMKNLSNLLSTVSNDIVDIQQNFEKSVQTTNSVGEYVNAISISMKEHTLAIDEGINNLNNVSNVAEHSFTVTKALKTAYEEINEVLKKDH